MRNRSLLCAVRLSGQDQEEFSCSIEELSELAKTGGYRVIDTVIQQRHSIDVKFFIGKGKIEEIKSTYSDQVDQLIFNHELSPSQARNIEKATGMNVRTRTEVILDIFALHARSKAARLQVEMAKLTYEMPRIIGKGIEMSRIEGGIHMKGPGEQQQELDKRKIRHRISLIKEDLEAIAIERTNQRKKRQKGEFTISIIGYTNSGKSTLLNRLTGAGVVAQDRLFVTLDTTTRKLFLSADRQAVITDTVGFIRDIPHGLIESFRSTFEDSIASDLLLHVIDVSASDFLVRMKVAEDTIRDMGGSSVKMIKCFNKSDRVPGGRLHSITNEYPDSVCVSALTGDGISRLKEIIMEAATTQPPVELISD